METEIETTIANFLESNYGKWYTVEELSNELNLNKCILAKAANTLYNSNGHIWRRLFDWRTKKKIRKRLYKYRNRTRTEQDEINKKMLEAHIGIKISD
jgi:predicted transcriptional regulator